MKYYPVDFPRPGVRAAAAENTDKSFTYYVNANLPEEDQKEAVEELARRIEEAGKGCMTSENCRSCALEADCEGTKRLVTSAPRYKVYHRVEPSKDRYSY